MLVLWMVLAIVLFLVELRHLAFYALFGAAGCVVAALIALAFPSAVIAQSGAAAAVAAVGVVAARPYVSRAFAFRRDGHVARGVHGGLIGQEALTLDEVGGVSPLGHVRLVGERWLAISGSGSPIPPSTTVLVTAVQGTTLVVWPVDGTSTTPDLGMPGLS